jgi:uncharacterized membrane protein YfcA
MGSKSLLYMSETLSSYNALLPSILGGILGAAMVSFLDNTPLLAALVGILGILVTVEIILNLRTGTNKGLIQRIKESTDKFRSKTDQSQLQGDSKQERKSAIGAGIITGTIVLGVQLLIEASKIKWADQLGGIPPVTICLLGLTIVALGFDIGLRFIAEKNPWWALIWKVLVVITFFYTFALYQGVEFVESCL